MAGTTRRPGPQGPGPSGPEAELVEDRYVGRRDLTHWYTPVGRGLVALARVVSRLLGPYTALVVILALGIAVSAALAYVAAEVYESVTEADGVAGLDRPLLDFALGVRSPFLDEFATVYTDIAGKVGMPVIAVAVMVLLAVRRRSWTPVILITAAGAGSLAMTVVGKDLIGRARPLLTEAVPPYEYSPSFPSGHTLNATVVAGIIAYVLILRQRKLAARVAIVVVAVVFAFTIGLSRVYLGHHWFTDVLAAWFLGAAWLGFVITAHRLFLTMRRSGVRRAGERREGGSSQPASTKST
jgi:membrane-associated phospholipid phosphatase